MAPRNMKPCPSHPTNGDVVWFPVVVPADAQYPGSPRQEGEIPLCPACTREMKR